MVYFKYKVELDTQNITDEECIYSDEKLAQLGVDKSVFVRYNEWPNRYFYAEGLSREMCIEMIKIRAKSLIDNAQLALKLIQKSDSSESPKDMNS